MESTQTSNDIKVKWATSGIFTIVIALIALSWQTINVARRNPVEALRYE